MSLLLLISVSILKDPEKENRPVKIFLYVNILYFNPLKTRFGEFTRLY